MNRNLKPSVQTRTIEGICATMRGKDDKIMWTESTLTKEVTQLFYIILKSEML